MQRSIALLLAVAAVATLAVVAIVAATRSTVDVGTIERGQPVPRLTGTTLDGVPFDLASLRGHPVVINFWGPSCVPCQTEFPLLAAKVREQVGQQYRERMDDPEDTGEFHFNAFETQVINTARPAGA